MVERERVQRQTPSSCYNFDVTKKIGCSTFINLTGIDNSTVNAINRIVRSKMLRPITTNKNIPI